jgi:Fe-S-cluster containining protein
METTPNFDNMIDDFHNEISLVMNKYLEATSITIDCKKGCSYCCCFRVKILIPEVFRIIRFLKKEYGGQYLYDMVPYLRIKFQTGSQLTDAEYFFKNIDCIFLDTQKRTCKIYNVRPFACIQFHSKNASYCKESTGLLNYDINNLISISAAKSIKPFLNAGLDMNGFELHSALLYAILQDNAERDWMDRKKIFPHVHGQI